MIRAAVAVAKTVFVDMNERDKLLKDTDLVERILKVRTHIHTPCAPYACERRTACG
jgi:DNA-binding FadR family transcriptional regulator